MDAKEVFTIGPEPPVNPPSGRTYHPTLFGFNRWPDIPNFSTDVWNYYRSVQDLSKKMFSLLGMSLGLPYDYFQPHITEPMNSMNMIWYPSRDHPSKPITVENQMGIGGHTDFECFTLLSQNNTEGLEIWNGKDWVLVPALQDAFVVNIGDMMAYWSNDKFHSTIHRARNHPTRDRYSIAFFSACNYDTVLRNLIPGEKSKFEEVLAGNHLLNRINKANEPLLHS
eukprot:TRINITY_DN5290_c0_g1_i3.p1 TRINITY_DN5290_c0_g1~~TRINITY_DN5290_c0_g1_i3.p1  ORF type:complete len:225 (+),score=34.46 TRINITY_DN5290_c0_g1_i3:580-1254(+)